MGGETDVVGRTHGEEAGFVGFRNFKCLDKVSNGGLSHGVSACQSFKFLVGFRHSVTAHNRLNGFSKYFPCVIQIGGKSFFVRRHST